jgi:hypothetical protein
MDPERYRNLTADVYEESTDDDDEERSESKFPIVRDKYINVLAINAMIMHARIARSNIKRRYGMSQKIMRGR